MNILGRVHARFVFRRRIRVLTDHLIALIPRGARVLDVGCGDGLLARAIMHRRPDVTIQGIDVQRRSETHVPMITFDGEVIPYGDTSFDIVMLVDVVHHAARPETLLREAVRTAGTAVVIKDHLSDQFLAIPTLRLMDWVGNAPHDVRLPYNYWPRRAWREAFASLGVTEEFWQERLGLYPPPASWMFDRSLHFIARLRRR